MATLNKGDNNSHNNNNSSAINHKIHTETNAVLDCEIYWVSKLLWEGAKCNTYKAIISTALFLILSFGHVLNIVNFLYGNSPASGL